MQTLKSFKKNSRDPQHHDVETFSRGFCDDEANIMTVATN